MDDNGAGWGALGEAVVFRKFFEDLPDPRQRAKVLYPLDEVLLLCLLAVLAGAETITDMARFGERKLAFLRRFRPFADGTPARDHLGDILASLDAGAFQRCFVAWVSSLIGVPAENVGQDVIAIDGSGRFATRFTPPPAVKAGTRAAAAHGPIENLPGAHEPIIRNSRTHDRRPSDGLLVRGAVPSCAVIFAGRPLETL